MRCFIAIDFPEEIKNRISEIQTELKKSGSDVKWVNPQQIHLTLYFFKNIDSEEMESISDQVKLAVLNYGAFELVLKGMGTFPPFRDPRVIWMGIDPSIKLNGIYQMIQKIGQPFGEENQKSALKEPYTPHVTIGRVRSRKNIHMISQKIKDYTPYLFGACRVNELIFLESRLNQGGPVYSHLKHFPL